jgi:peroxiredoxin
MKTELQNLKLKTIMAFMVLFASGSIMAQGYKVGDKAQDFTLKNIDGKMVSLSDFNSQKGVILIFTCNHCPFAVAYQDRIIALDKKYKKLGYPVVAINPNDPVQYPEDSYENMKIRAEEKGFTFPYLFDEKQEVFPVYGATKTPHVYLLQKDGNGFKVAYIGAIDDSAKDESTVKETYLANAINALLEGKVPNPSETKAIGCSIKVKS